MSLKRDLKVLAEMYTSVEGLPVTSPNMLGGKPVMITMDMPGAEVDHVGHKEDNIENREENDPSEIEMALAELHKISEYAPKLQDLVQQMSGLEGWISSKITKAADYISSVYHWLEFQQHEGGESCGRGTEKDMYNAGHEDVEECPYAKEGCTCGGCPNCH